MLSAAALQPIPDVSMVELLTQRLRPPFSSPVIRVDADDPVFGRGRCSVPDCDRTSWALQLCQAHHQRWHHHGKPDPVVFAATTGPVALRAGSENVDAFDLSALQHQHRLEIAYVLQCRHDDRAVRVLTHTITDMVTVLEQSGATSFLDRPLQVWLDEAATLGRGDVTRTVALFRYAYEHLADIGGIDIDAECATDVWQAKRLGIARTRSPHQIRFDARAEIARSRIRNIRRLDREVDALTKRLVAALNDTRTSLTSIYGVGPLVAAEILAETGDPARFTTKARFAMANGTAPIEASSGRVVRHRLNRGGNRQLNKAIHIAAIAQISKPDTEGRTYYQRCLDRGKSKREAIRALKRRISDRVWTCLQNDIQTTNPAPKLT